MTLPALAPYRLPPGNVQISFSGGRTSGYMLYHIAEANGGLDRERVQVVFANTGREMPQTLDFVAEVAEQWGIPIIWVEYRPGRAGQQFKVVNHNSAARDGEPFAALNQSKAFLPNRKFRICTAHLKLKPARDYLRSIGWEHWTAAIGIRADEPHRHEGKRALKERWQRWLPLVPAVVARRDVVDWWKRQPFDLRLGAVNGNSVMGNCDGCFLKSEAHNAMLARDYPERHAWWEEQERLAAERWFTLSPWARLRRLRSLEAGACANLRVAYGRPIPSRVLAGFVDQQRVIHAFSNRFTRRALRQTVERMGPGLFSTKGSLCQASDGECVE